MATWMTCCLIRRWVWPTALRCAQKKKDMFISRKLAFQNADMTPKKKWEKLCSPLCCSCYLCASTMCEQRLTRFIFFYFRLIEFIGLEWSVEKIYTIRLSHRSSEHPAKALFFLGWLCCSLLLEKRSIIKYIRIFYKRNVCVTKVKCGPKKKRRMEHKVHNTNIYVYIYWLAKCTAYKKRQIKSSKCDLKTNYLNIT